VKKALITGATGMAGSYMIEYLLENQPDYEILACRRRHSDMANADFIESDRLKWVELDLTDPYEVNKMIQWFQPDKIFHLAAQSFVPRSWKAPVETVNVNVIGTINLFEAIREHKKDCVIQVACSSEEYGMVYEDEVPIKETNTLRPLSPYACSKVMLENLSYTYNRSYGLKIVITRAFNHTGVRRGEEFICAQVCKQAAEIASKKSTCFFLGNMDAKRDFTDVRDVVRAYWLATEKCDFGVPYNVASNKAYSIREVVDIVAEYAGISNEVKQNPDRMRPADVPILLGDYSKLKEKTGWEPEYDFKEDTLAGMYITWVERVTGKPETQILI